MSCFVAYNVVAIVQWLEEHADGVQRNEMVKFIKEDRQRDPYVGSDMLSLVAKKLTHSPFFHGIFGVTHPPCSPKQFSCTCSCT